MERKKEAEAELERAHRYWNNFSLAEKLLYIRTLDSAAKKGKHYYSLLEFTGRCHLDIAKHLISTNFSKEAHAHAKLASRHLKRAISVNEHYHMGYFLLGVALEIQDQRKQAQKCYKRANKLDPLDANVINALKRLSN
jgi:tetratricopeptide (TPR) repeat protein